MERIPKSRMIIFFGVACAICVSDLLVKHLLFAWPKLNGGAVHWLWKGYVGFQQSLNEGALFGLGQGWAKVFAGISVIAVILIPVWLFYFRAATDKLIVFCMGLVTGGIVGNLYDRVGMHGLKWERFSFERKGDVFAVRDWMLLQWGDHVWPNFNIADAALVCGAILLMWHGLFIAQPSTSKKEADKETAK